MNATKVEFVPGGIKWGMSPGMYYPTFTVMGEPVNGSLMLAHFPETWAKLVAAKDKLVGQPEVVKVTQDTYTFSTKPVSLPAPAPVSVVYQGKTYLILGLKAKAATINITHVKHCVLESCPLLKWALLSGVLSEGDFA